MCSVTADARMLVILNPATGAEQRRVELEADASLCAPALANGVIYIPCPGPYLLALGLDGRPRWRFVDLASDAWLNQTPILVGERLYAVYATGAALALQAGDGALAWRVDVGPAGRRLSAPATDGQRLFIGARDGLHALALADGRKQWAFATNRQVEAAPVVSGGVLYATCHDHHLYALDAATGRELWHYEVERRVEIPPLVAATPFVAIDQTRDKPLVLVAHRKGALTAVTRTLDAARQARPMARGVPSPGVEPGQDAEELERAARQRQEIIRLLLSY